MNWRVPYNRTPQYMDPHTPDLLIMGFEPVTDRIVLLLRHAHCLLKIELPIFIIKIYH